MWQVDIPYPVFAPRPPRLHCFELDLNEGKLLGRRQMPLEDQWLGAFIKPLLCIDISCSKTGCLKRIFLQPNKSATKATRLDSQSSYMSKKLELCIWRDTMQVVWMFRLICQPSILSEMGKRLFLIFCFVCLVVFLYVLVENTHPSPLVFCARQGIATSLVLGDLKVGSLFDPYWRQILEAALWPIGMLVMGLVLSTSWAKLWQLWSLHAVVLMTCYGVFWKLYNFLRCIVSEPLFLPNGLGGTKWLGEEHEDDGWLVRRLAEVFYSLAVNHPGQLIWNCCKAICSQGESPPKRCSKALGSFKNWSAIAIIIQMWNF